MTTRLGLVESIVAAVSGGVCSLATWAWSVDAIAHAVNVIGGAGLGLFVLWGARAAQVWAKMRLIRAQNAADLSRVRAVVGEVEGRIGHKLDQLKDGLDTNQRLLLEAKSTEAEVLRAATTLGLLPAGAADLSSLLITPDSMRAAAEILIVEDDPATVRLYDRLFRRAGYSTKVAFGLQEALARISFGVSGVFLDLTLPDGPGEQLVDFVNRAGLPIRIVVTTGSGDSERIAAVRSKVHAVLPKPVADFNLVFKAFDQLVQHEVNS